MIYWTYSKKVFRESVDMNNLNSVDFRDKCRRVEERRIVSRRIINHPFGSAKWIKAVQTSYLLWPKEDRRIDDRRSVSRRMTERRIQIHKPRRRTTHQRTLNEHIQKPLLTAEEIRMLRELSRRL
jgi:hypothetical protein